MKKKQMFVLIATAVKKLRDEAKIPEDDATTIVLMGLKAFPDNLVMDPIALPSILEEISNDYFVGHWRRSVC
tara:strand:- start:2130 stop:2345 length:216 start_codon:yes stop_codon:yes gene_type:complete